MRQLALTIIVAGYMQHAMESERQSMQRGFRYKRKTRVHRLHITRRLECGKWITYIIISEMHVKNHLMPAKSTQDNLVGAKP